MTRVHSIQRILTVVDVRIHDGPGGSPTQDRQPVDPNTRE